MGQRGLLSAVFGKETRSFLHLATPTVATESTKSRFHGIPRNPRNQRFQRNHDSTVPPENHETNDFNEITISRPPNGITKPTKPTKKTKRPEKRRFVVFVVYVSIVISLGTLRGADMLLITLRLPVALSVSFADSSPTGGAKSTPVGAGQAVVRRTSLRLCLTTRLPGLTAVRLAPPSGELARRPQGGETERGATPVSASGTRGGSSRKSGGTAGKSCWGCRSRSRRRSGRCCRPGGPAGRRRPA